ncbi:MAG: rRNA maturation RNase YbeY [SAR324 cluster bacterium]|nr:rRNA maturation RNase YbeY [SAR324 cluster bacterium]
MEISCSDTTVLPLTKVQLEHYLHSFFETLGFPDRNISLYFTDDQEIQELNRHYRNQDKPTDVLSWSYWEQDPDSEVLGDIVISLDRIKKQAKLHNFSEKVELIRLLAHGCAHLVGYDHELSPLEEQKMLEVEIEMLKRVGFSNIYSRT